MTDWVATDFRKLFVNPPPDFERMPFMARAAGAEMVRRCDREGQIIPVGEGVTVTAVTSQPSLMSQLVTDVAFHVRAHSGEENAIEQALRWLFKDKYLVIKQGYLTIRNFPTAQRSSSAERMARKRARDGKSPASHSDASDVTTVTSVTSDKSDQEEKRREEIPLVPHESIRETAIRAYGEGIETVTGVGGFAMTETEERAVMAGVEASPKWVGLRGEMLGRAIRKSAADYARDRQGEAKFEKGFAPSKWLEWLRSAQAPESKVQLLGTDSAAQRSARAQEAILRKHMDR